MGVGLCAAAAVWLAALSVYDVLQRRLPNWLTLPGAAVIVTCAVLAGRGWPALAGAAALAGLYLVVHLVAPAGIGAGDVKLALGIGALTGSFGLAVWLLAALAAPLLTAAWGVVALIRRGSRTVPHGPAMSAAALAAAALVVL